MDLNTAKAKIKAIFVKYKFVLLVVGIGILLMIIPNKKTTQEVHPDTIVPQQQTDPESLLANILCQIDGAGRVEVMLTVLEGEKTVYQTDSDLSEGQNGQTNHSDTVIITGSDRLQNGLITQVIPPVYQGAIIVCDGADDPNIRLRIVEAVSRSTGLGADRISVLKMK